MDSFSYASLPQDIFLDALVSSLAIIRYTDEGFITYASQPFLNTTGYGVDDIVGRPCSLLASATSPTDSITQKRWATQSSVHSAMGTITAKDGTILPVESIFYPISNEKGSLRHIVEICFFVTLPIAQGAPLPAPLPAKAFPALQVQDMADADLRLLAQVVQQSENALIISDLDNNAIFVNESFTRMFGYEQSEFIGKKTTSIYGRADEKVAAKQQVAIRAGSTYRSQKIAYGKTGHPLWVFIVAAPVLNKEGVHTHTVSIITDITDIKIHDRLQNKTLEALMRGVSSTEILSLICYEVERILRDITIGIIGTTALDHLVLLAGPNLPYAVGNSFSTMDLSIPEDCLTAQAISQKRRITIEDTSNADRFPTCCRVLWENGINACTVFPILSNNLRPLGAIAFNFATPRLPDKFHLRLAGVMARLCAFVLEREQIRSTIRNLTHYDSLTGLPNRQLILATGNQVLAKIRNANKKAAILLLNLDKFKRVNESMGHLAGDKLLHAIGRNLHSLWNDKGMVGRMASDEFTLIIEISDNTQVENLVKEVQQVVSIPQHFNDITLLPTCCVGISLFPDTDTNFEALLQCASLALSQAKSCGVGSYSFFDQGKNKYARMQLTMESALRVAIGSPEIALFYQPQVYIGSGKLHGVEALSRWYSSAFGMVSPSRFIPIAEDSGVILQLNAWLIQEACRQLGDWRRRGVNIPTVSINLSAKSFHDQSLIALLLECTQRYSLNPGDLLLELTESVLLDPNPETLNTIHETARAGFKFSLDDFGTGYSSLSYLRELPISELKLDSSFAKDLQTNETNRRLSKAIMGIGMSLGLSVVAEGIETPEQLSLLRHQGYTIAQGYLYAQAMPPEQLERWLDDIQTVDSPSEA